MTQPRLPDVPVRRQAVPDAGGDHRQAGLDAARTVDPAFHLVDVAVEVPGRTLLHPLSLELPAGRIIGLLGQNGSGKSTLLKLLARQARPTRGTLSLLGRPLIEWSDRAFARKVAYLPQDVPVTTGLTVRELVALGRYPWHGALGRFSQADGQKVDAALDRTGLAPLAGRALATLSGGERQRAWIAMLIAQDAEMLLLDEPISALDIGHQIEVLDLVRSASREHALGVVVVLHEVNLAARFCDEILALKGGRLVAREAAAGFMTETTLQAVYDVPMTVFEHPKSGRKLAWVA